ncbi:MAG TPA: DUF1553 domain-containing protein [Verrucomicrobiae bacterium]|nr:DUF1553 domain-containing protein [Verrucomicrobiae bacterium]
MIPSLRSRWLVLICAAYGALLLATLPIPVRAANVLPLEYNRDIRPILSDRCFKCHGFDKASRKAGLRLDTPEGAYAERKKSGKHAIVPGKPDESLVCEKIFATDPDDRMPPPESNLSLTESEKGKIRRWIQEGAKYQPHWAFVPLPARIAVPEVRRRDWPRNEIDHFILARLEKEGLKPSSEAPRSRWLRRVTYDLTGLPPVPAEIEAFLKDNSANAYETVVDRLLASPHFGQRMAVPWLDAARYADSYGYQSDLLSPTWPYRDWVVRSFNRNLPYDKFIIDQLAGDLLPSPTREERLATAYNRLHRQTNEGGSIEEEWRDEYVADRVQTLSTSILGLTFECAHCHDHKFDPITQRDYYSLSAFFNSIDEYGLYNSSDYVPTPSLLLPTAPQESAMKSSAADLDASRAAEQKAQTTAENDFADWLAQSNLTSVIPGLAAYFSFDHVNATNEFASDAGSSVRYTSGIGGNKLEPGHTGMALRMTGDDQLDFPTLTGGLQPWEQYSIVFWMKTPPELTNGVVFHRCQGTDTGFHGTELDLKNGRLFFVIKRFWPGNAIAVQAREPLPTGQWVQVAVTSDGSARAAGISLFVNGRRLAAETVRDHLYKGPDGPRSGISFGALFRSAGLKNGCIDDLRVYDRKLAVLEVRELFDGHSLRDALASRAPGQLREYYMDAISPSMRSARNEVSAAARKFFEARNPVLETSVMREMPEPRPTFVLARGRYDAPKTDDKRVTRSTPGFLVPFPANAPKNRLGLAEWLTLPNHPLTARVAVNRFWQMLFGRGIVATSDNFGMQGSEPTHPELLDWLARDFVSSGWNVKATLKKIVLSATYRQDSRPRPELLKADPENLLLGRGPSHRLSAEMIRDTALAASGLLDDRLGGPPVSPYSPGDLWRESNSMSPAYHQSVGKDLYRRSLYTVWKRTAAMPDMTAFDAPSREVCIARRSVTSTPQQAFVLLNDPQFVEAARVLAEKTLGAHSKAGGSSFEEIFLQLAGRKPDNTEAAVLQDLFAEQKEIFSKEPDRARELLAVGASKADASLDPIQLAAMTIVAQAVMNADATVWVR